MTAQDVLNKVRLILSDPSADIYSDASLISLLNDAVRAFAADTKVAKDVYYIELDSGITTYDVSAKLLEIDRIQYQGKVLPIVSNDYMDKLNNGWQLEDGEDVKTIVYDKTRRGVFRIYPRITSTDLVIDTNSNYGILIEFDVSHEPNYLTAEDIPFTAKYLTIYGISKPDTITLAGDTIDVDDQWTNVLAHHVAGSALRLDQDSQNRAVGNEELMLYTNNVINIKNNVMQNFTEGDLEVAYRRF